MSNKPKIIIAGGSGLLGQILCDAWHDEYELVVLSTSRINVRSSHCRFVYWNAKRVGEWSKELEGAEAVINFSGKSINCLHTNKNKELLITSRVVSTQTLGKAIASCVNPPRVWINASATAIYGNSDSVPHTELDQFAPGFLAELTRLWEHAFYELDVPRTRRIALRIGVVLTKKGGVLGPLKLITRLGLGGKAGSGKQFISWIHQHDLIELIRFCIQNTNMHGALNAVAPYPVTNREFMQTLRKAMNIPVGIPAPEFAIKLGCLFVGTQPELVLASRRDISLKLNEFGFKFAYPLLTEALTNLLE